MTVSAQFASKKFWRDLKARTGHVDTFIDYGDVTRYAEEAANDSGAGEVSFGTIAREQVQRVFGRYGFPPPATWSELRGNHLFLERVERVHRMLVVGFSRYPQAGLELLASKHSDIQAEVRAYLDGGLEGLVRHLRETAAFQRNAQRYNEATDSVSRA